MNNIDKQYQTLLQDILDNGVGKKDRTGTGTISVFGRQIRHKMSEGFPLLTTKKMPFKTIITELLWFLRGDTNIKFLVDNDCHIWDGDCYKRYCTEWAKYPSEGVFSSNEYSSPTEYEAVRFTQEEFINKIKTDDEFAKKWGDLGKIYGKQWRKWGGHLSKNIERLPNGQDRRIYEKGVDQIQNLINDLKTNPDSRRLMVSAWNVGELDQMVLPPCHYGFQVYTRLTTREEKITSPGKYRAISLMFNMRSCDTFLGLPFNIASYGLLLEIIAKAVNMVPDELIGNLGDVHLYSNHIEQAKEQIGRGLTDEERYNIWFNNNYETGMERYFDPNNLPDYENDYYDPTPKRTREPFPLPTITLPSMLIPNTNNWDKLVFEDFYLNDYQSHPAIKAPLSN